MKPPNEASPPDAGTDLTLIEIWRALILNKQTPWVLFKNGTCVVLAEPADLEGRAAEQAVAILKAWGPVQVGTPAGDFSVVPLDGLPGWVVTSHHEHVNTYVAPAEVGLDAADELTIGLVGRAKRERDADELEILHIES